MEQNNGERAEAFFALENVTKPFPEWVVRFFKIKRNPMWLPKPTKFRQQREPLMLKTSFLCVSNILQTNIIILENVTTLVMAAR